MPVSPKAHKPHTRNTKRHYPQHSRPTSSTQRGYGYRWQKARAGYLARHPLCRHCTEANRITVATDLDHITPHKGDMELFWDRTNWQGLCKSCHSTKTATEDGGFGNRGKGGSN